MEERETKTGCSRTGRRPSAVATIGFLLIAGALIYGCVRLVNNVLVRELQRAEAPGSRTVLRQASPSPAPAAPTPDPALSAAAVHAETLSPSPVPTPTLIPEASAAPAPTVSPAPTPEATLRPVAEPGPFSGDSMDLLFAMFDERSGADWISLLSVRGAECRILSVPRNTLTPAGTPIGEETGPRRMLSKLPGVFPVRYGTYVSVAPDGLSRFIDRFGAIHVDGREMGMDAVDAYLSGGGADELLRILRQQEVLRACLRKLRSMSWLDILTSRTALQSSFSTNLTAVQQLELFALLRRTDPQKVRFDLLAVDSVWVDGARFYRSDALLANALAEELFPS